MIRFGPYETCRLEGPVGLSGPGRELSPRMMGARKYPVTSVCQPLGCAAGCSWTGVNAGGVTEAGGGCARGGSSAARSVGGTGAVSTGAACSGSASVGSCAAAENDARHTPSINDACSRMARPLLAVTGGDDVGLQRVQGGQAGGVARHHPLEPFAPVAVAVVAADSHDDGPLLVHGDIAGLGRPDPVVHRLERPGGRVGAVEREAPLAAVLVGRVAHQDGGDVVVLERRVGRDVLVLVVFPAREQAVLQVGHHPGAVVVTARRAGAPHDAAAEVDRLHGAVAVVVRVGLGVAVVEAAAVDQVVLAGHHVLRL